MLRIIFSVFLVVKTLASMGERFKFDYSPTSAGGGGAAAATGSGSFAGDGQTGVSGR